MTLIRERLGLRSKTGVGPGSTAVAQYSRYLVNQINRWVVGAARQGQNLQAPGGQYPSEDVSRLTSPAAIMTPVSGSLYVTVGAQARQFQSPQDCTS